MKRETARRGLFAFTLASLTFAAAAGASADTPASSADADFLAKVAPAAPAPIVAGATIVAMEKGGTMRTIRKGTNDFTCTLMPNDTPVCADKNATEWMAAIGTHATPPADKMGFAYMLAGDRGTSNTDPFAEAATPTNHWVTTGPHVMLLGPAAKSLGYARTPDADTTKPFVMWAGTPYEHVMIPTK